MEVMEMSKINSDPICVLLELWLKEKKYAIKTNNWELYEFTLKESRKSLLKIYAKANQKWLIDVLGKLIKVATCEIQEIIIKYKKM